MEGSKCVEDGECSYLWECSNNMCEHEPLWPPSFLVVLSMILLPILIGIGNVGGLGGGITKVPILMLMLNYTQQYATYQAYCIQFGACISNAVLLFGQRHPKRDRPLIDYNYALIIVPICVLGTTLGIYANDFVPELITNIIFTTFLVSVMPYLFKKSQKLRKEEIQINQAKKAGSFVSKQSIASIKEMVENDITSPIVEQNDTKQKQEEDIQDQNSDESFLSQEGGSKSSELQQVINLEKQTIPWVKFGIIAGSFILIQLINFIIGTKQVKSIFGFTRCSIGFWIFTAILPVSILTINLVAYFITSHEENIKIENGYKFEKDDLPLTKKNFIKVSLAGITSGFLAGALGAGGGLSMVTFLMALGINSRVASATTGLNNIFIGTTSILNVIFNSKIPLGQILLFTGVAFIGGVLVSKVIYYVVQKYNRTSAVVFFVFLFCIINLASNNIYLFKTADVNGGWGSLLDTNSFC